MLLGRRRYYTIFLPHVAWAGVLAATYAFAACSSTSSGGAPSDAGNDALADAAPGDSAIAGLSPALLEAFAQGEQAFNHEFTPSEGLGPLYTQPSCGKCHESGIRGPGFAQKMVVVLSDGLTASPDQSLLPFGNTIHPQIVTDIPGVLTPIVSPFDGGIDGGDAGPETIRVTMRLGPPVFGRGYMEAIEDSEIERVASEQASRTDGIHGRVNHVTFVSSPNPTPTFDNHQTGDVVIGRFGLKARISTLDEFAADALQGDIGITSPMRTTEFKNPDGVTDDLKSGVDVTTDDMNARGMYPRLLAIPPRIPSAAGKAWFEFCNCHVCHAETLHTRADYPIPQLADMDAPVYTDMLIHDMGDTLSDSVTGGNEGEAGPRDWRTLPLIGLRFNTTYLHDGRAPTITDAILDHDGPGSEAQKAVQCFRVLTPDSKVALLDFLNGV